VSSRYVWMMIEGLVTAGFFGLLAWGAAHGRPKLDRDSDGLIFRYSGAARAAVIALAITVALFLGFLVYKIPIKSESDVYAVCGMFAMFFLLLGPLVWEFTRFSIVVSSEGLNFRSAWRAGFFMAWQDVEAVSYSLMWQWFVIRSTHGQKIHVPKLIGGIGDFLGELAMNLDPAVMRKARSGFTIVGVAFPENDIMS
jgi:hypothetical protein